MVGWELRKLLKLWKDFYKMVPEVTDDANDDRWQVTNRIAFKEKKRGKENSGRRKKKVVGRVDKDDGERLKLD